MKIIIISILCTRKQHGSQKKFYIFIWNSATTPEHKCNGHGKCSELQVSNQWQLEYEKVRRTLGSKDCNLAKKRRLMDCSWANSLNSLREVGISIAWLISSSVQNGAKDLHGSKCAFSPRTRKGIPNDQSLWGDSEWRTPKARWVKSLTFVPKAEECTIYRKTRHLQRRIQIIFIMS